MCALLPLVLLATQMASHDNTREHLASVFCFVTPPSGIDSLIPLASRTEFSTFCKSSWMAGFLRAARAFDLFLTVDWLPASEIFYEC